MMDLTLSDDQNQARQKVLHWFKHECLSPDRPNGQQVFRLFGPAGSGKTSIVRPIIEELGLTDIEEDEDGRTRGDVIYGTQSGKAADVLRTKGIPARTIHSFCYTLSPDDKAAINECRGKVRKLKDERGSTTNVERISIIEKELAARREELTKLTDPRFNATGSEALRNAKLIVLDEVSMVGGQMAADVLQHGIPCLVLGDPFQLPPIEKDGGAFTEAPADFLLTQIHRQAAGNPILALSQLIRNNGFLPSGDIDGRVFITHHKPTPEEMAWADQVIVGKNVTRYELNNRMREVRGYADPYPMGPHEKLICVRNNKDHQLFNGQAVSVHDCTQELSYLLAKITSEGGTPKKEQPSAAIYRGHFDNCRSFDPDRLRNDYFARLNSVEIDYAYALTCHKSQGSEWNNVIVVNDGWGMSSEEKRRWLYTAVTRARENLGIILGWSGR